MSISVEDLADWVIANTKQLIPLSPDHWSVKAARVARTRALALGWKRLARRQSKEIMRLRAALEASLKVAK